MPMRIGSTLVAVMVLIGAILLYGSERASASGRALTQPKLEMVQPAAATRQPQEVAQVAPTQASADLAAEVEALVNRWATQFQPAEGWLHTVLWYDRNREAAGVLPNGQAIPLDFYQDNWYQLNDQNRAVTVVSIMRDSSERVVQVGIFQEGAWRNTATPDEPPRPAAAEPIHLNFAYPQYVAMALAASDPVGRREEPSADGQKRLIFTIRHDQPTPITLTGFTQSVVSTEKDLAVDAATGEVLWADTVVTFASGEKLLSEHVEYVTIELASSPPAEVLAYLK